MNKKFHSILFLGAGGVSMHQLALAMHNLGLKVYCYDAQKNEYLQLLEKNGIKTSTKFEKTFLNVDLCVASGAIKQDNKYIQALKFKNVEIVDRAVFLGWICAKFKTVIAVAGTHGKSSTASLIYEILRINGEKVSCHIGADVFAPRFNFDDDYLVVEACEYNKSFLSIYPNIAVITNVEAEHMDCYKNLFSLKSAFSTFIKRAKFRFVYNEKSTNFLKRYKNINFVDKTDLKLKPKILGEYNLKNISLAVAVAKQIGVTDDVIVRAVNNFNGVPRRYEYLGKYKDNKIYIDYAHHPTEIQSFISTFMLQNCSAQIVFQPHTYSRTKNFLKKFIEVFKTVNNLCIFKEYPARETSNMGLSAYQLYLKIKKINPLVEYAENEKQLSKFIKSSGAIAFVGAGDINLIAKKFVAKR